MTWDFNVAFMPYTQAWRDHRLIFRQYFNQREVAKFEAIQIKECLFFLRQMLDTPDNLAQHVRQYVYLLTRLRCLLLSSMFPLYRVFTIIILKVVYGMDIRGPDDEYLLLAQEAVLGAIQSRVAGAFCIEFFPFLKCIASWIPGAKFKQVAEHHRPCRSYA